AGKSDEVVSMDDPAIYGDTFHLLSFKRAMEFDPPILSDYKIISICVSREEVAKLIRKNVFLKPDKGPWRKDVEADMLASLIALRKAMSKHPIRHAVSFHSSIQRAEVFKIHNDAFTQIAPEFGDLATYHVSGATPTGTRSRIVSDFARSERALITNARCLTEGVDVPGIDCVLFADPRRSAVDIVQAVGRALRPSQGKECGYVIVPILHDENATPEDIFDSESFQEILSTLRSLAANDERIIEYFRAVSEGRKTTSGGVTFDIDERIAKNIDLTEFVREIELKCWDRLEGLRKDRLTIKQILEWADLHRSHSGKWPQSNSGSVRDAPEENWSGINAALINGTRGMPGGSSLAQALEVNRNVPNKQNLPQLTVTEILRWADAHHNRTGKWPTRDAGGVYDAPHERWSAINNALGRGLRGLPGGMSLTRLLEDERQVRNTNDPGTLTEEKILEWADANYNRTGEWPRKKSGEIVDVPGETWSGIHSALCNGRRGLPSGSSLAKLLEVKRGVRNPKNLPRLTEKQILEWADAHRERTGEWPVVLSGNISGHPDEHWNNIHQALAQGSRGLPGGSSLAKLLEAKRGSRNIQNLSPLTEEQILIWADAHRVRTGKWPKNGSGEIASVPCEHWRSIDSALIIGLRGLPGGSSLAKLLEVKRGVRNPQNLPRLTEEQILEWADAHHKQTGKWPSQSSGDVISSPGETWKGIITALFRGRRGLSGDSSLAKLLETRLGVKNRGNLPPLTERQILKWADDHRVRTGTWPKNGSGEIASASCEHWRNIDSALMRGLRGLPGGSSLAKLLEVKRGVRNHLNIPRLTEEQILEWADAHRKRTGTWPRLNSGEIDSAPSEKWININAALRIGLRQLPGGSSLAKLIASERSQV
ncbi:MAG: helicase-related protein, partial [Verrucomicrobia bacterium]|nr:helicase-related protein [Verrucomicrobiota bacterium]